MQVDPVAMAALASAVTALGRDYAKGVVSEAGKATWRKVTSLLGWKTAPPPEDLAKKTEEALVRSPADAVELTRLLQNGDVGSARSLVEHIDATKVIVIGEMHGNIDFR